MREVLHLRLPWPPTVNRYWRRVLIGGRPRTLVSREGRAYRQAVLAAVFGSGKTLWGDLAVTIDVYPPDRRKRRDLDNLLKAPLDAMEAARVYADDSQVCELHIYRHGCRKDSPGLHVAIHPVTVTEGPPQHVHDAQSQQSRDI